MAIIGMLVITILIVMAMSYVATLIWGLLFASTLPGYISGLIGGLTALPAWETVKRLRKKDESSPDTSKQ